MPRIGIKSGLRRAVAEAAPTRTGLRWNLSNGDAGSHVLFNFRDGNVIQRYPRTEIRRITPRFATGGYHTIMFRCAFNTPGSFTGNRKYEGSHGYPYGGTRHWEISIEGTDTPLEFSGLDDNGNSTAIDFDREHIQVTQQYVDGSGNLVTKFYYDLAAGLTRVITWTMAAATSGEWGDAADTRHIFGSSPWTETSGSSTETLEGDLRGNQLYADKLSTTDFSLEAANQDSSTPVTAAGLASVWYHNNNPTVADITDKSGQGHDPVWVGDNRPQDYTV